MAITRLVIELDHEPDEQNEATAALLELGGQTVAGEVGEGAQQFLRYYVEEIHESVQYDDDLDIDRPIKRETLETITKVWPA